MCSSKCDGGVIRDLRFLYWTGGKIPVTTFSFVFMGVSVMDMDCLANGISNVSTVQNRFDSV